MTFKNSAITLLISLIGALATTIHAQEPAEIGPLPGWTYNDKAGVVITGNAISYSSPVVGDIDGDKNNGQEIVVVTEDAYINVLKSDGTVLWSKNLPNGGCGSSRARVGSTPAIGALYGDGTMYAVASYGSLLGEEACGAGVVAYRGSDGAQKWNFSTISYDSKRRKLHSSPSEYFHTVFSSPALSDVNNDGKLKIAFGSWDRHVYLLNNAGRVIWNYEAADTVWSSATFFDVNNDGNKDVIIGTDISQNDVIVPATKNGGFVVALNGALTSRNTLYHFRETDALLWSRWMKQTVFAAPSLGDVVPEVPGPEIVIASGYYFPENTTAKTGKWLKVINPLNGKVLRNITMPACSASSVAIGDVNDDGVNEVVALTNGTTQFGGSGPVYLSVWRVDQRVKLWEQELESENGYYYFNSPTIADLDGNGSLEVIIAHKKRIRIFNGADGTEYSCPGSCDDGRPVLNTGNSMMSTPTIADINYDGKLEIIAGSGRNGATAAVYVWSGFDGLLGSPQGAKDPCSAPWPTFRNNPQHTGELE